MDVELDGLLLQSGFGIGENAIDVYPFRSKLIQLQDGVVCASSRAELDAEFLKPIPYGVWMGFEYIGNLRE